MLRGSLSSRTTWADRRSARPVSVRRTVPRTRSVRSSPLWRGDTGGSGMAPFRVRRVLDATPDASGRVQAAASLPVAVYACLGDHGVSQLPGLGPSFGIKFL